MRIFAFSGLTLFCANLFFCFSKEIDDVTGSPRVLDFISETVNIKEKEAGTYEYPDDVEFTIDIQGLGRKHILGRKVGTANKNPEVVKLGNRPKPRRKSRKKREVEYYTSKDGSYACRPTTRNGAPHCDWMGIVHGDNQTCLIKGGVAHCADIIEGTTEAYEPPKETVPVVPYPGNRTVPPVRKKRQITQPDAGVRVIQAAIFADARIMQRFYNLNPGDVSAAEEDCETYITMLANEITYRLQTIKDLNIPYRGGILDLAVNPKIIIYPDFGEDLPFLSKSGEYLFTSATLTSFRSYINTGQVEGTFDHAMLISGLDLYSSSSSTLGVAYLSTVCATSGNRFYRVSLNEDRRYNVAGTAAHELGHALGAQHDSNGNSCPSSGYVMAAISRRPTISTQDTIFTFSTCSGTYFANHLSSNPDCLSSSSDNGFVDNFCDGPRGLRDVSFDYQCQTYYRYGSDYSECFDTTAVSADGCWLPYSIFCYPGSGGTCYGLPFLMDGSPCTPSNPQQGKKYYCYLGDCEEEDTICPVATPEPPTPPPPTPPPPTQPPPTQPPPTPPPTQPPPTQPPPTQPPPTQPPPTQPPPTQPPPTQPPPTPPPTQPPTTQPPPTQPPPTQPPPTQPPPTQPPPTPPPPTPPPPTPPPPCACDSLRGFRRFLCCLFATCC